MEISNVESIYSSISGIKKITTKIPYVLVDNYPQLGLLNSMRFLEWASQNPEGVVSLPIGKTSEHFIKYTQFLLSNWDTEKGVEIRGKYGLGKLEKPNLRGLHFVQSGEFYPINPIQHNSFCNYVTKYYIKGFGLDINKALLINSDMISLAEGKAYHEIFPDLKIDLSLRYRKAKNRQEELQKESILMIDDWCNKYEEKIRTKGGIGFFLAEIGPDGHVAFNTQGASHLSVTRLTSTNFETQAVAAGDLGGIEVSRNRLVITIGLETITYNPEAVAIVFAAGEAKAKVVKNNFENEPSTRYPASALQKLKNARFFLTQGAAAQLTDTIDRYFNEGDWTHQKTERAVIDLCKKVNKFGPKLTMDDLKNDPYCRLIPGLDEKTVLSVIESITGKIKKGMAKESGQVYYHTGPHHDDIMLGIMPAINRQMRNASNEMHFSVLTSGFTAVTNKFLMGLLRHTLELFNKGKIEMINYPDFFDQGYKFKWDKDVYHYLDNIAANNQYEKTRGVCHRLVRAMVEIWGIKDKDELEKVIKEILTTLDGSYDGSKNPPLIQKLKGMIRELEEELVWAHFGVQVKNIHHLRLGFYQGDVFSSKPDLNGDILPILNEFRKHKPTVLSLAMDPQGSGPDTHYKVLQAIAGAVQEWAKEEDLSELKIIGYRNVWFTYQPHDVELIVPVSLNSLATLNQSFAECYLSQVNASFPSYQLDGKFSELAQKTWVEQHKQIQFLLGKNYFYENESPLLRATHGLVYARELNVEQFLGIAFSMEKSTEVLI